MKRKLLALAVTLMVIFGNTAPTFLQEAVALPVGAEETVTVDAEAVDAESSAPTLVQQDPQEVYRMLSDAFGSSEGTIPPPSAPNTETQPPLAPDANENGWIYTATSDSAVVTGYSGAVADALTVPYLLGGVPVTEIASNALGGLSGVTSVTISGNVKILGENALPPNVTVRAYHGAYALSYAQAQGLSTENLSTYLFVPHAIDFSDIAEGRYAYTSDKVILMRSVEASRLTVGSAFYLPPSAKYPDGEAFGVLTMDSPYDGWTSLNCEILRGADIIERIVINEQNLQPDWENAVWADGFTPVGNTVSPMGFNIVTGDLGVSENIDLPLAGDDESAVKKEWKHGNISVSGEFELALAADVNIDINLYTNEIREMTVLLTPDFNASISITGAFEKSFPIVTVPFLNGLIVAELALNLEAEVSGALSVNIQDSIGIQYDHLTKQVKPVTAMRVSTEVSLSGQVSDMLDLSVAIQVPLVDFEILKLGFAGGVIAEASATAKTGAELSETIKTDTLLCLELIISVGIKAYIESECPGITHIIGYGANRKWEPEEEWDFFERKWPLWEWHIENGKRVDGCTFLTDITATFESLGVVDIPVQALQRNGKATQPVIAKEYADLLLGWYTDASYTKAFDFSTPVVQSITLYAKWKPEVRLGGGAGGGSGGSFGGGAGGGTGGGTGGTPPVIAEPYTGDLEYYENGTSITIDGFKSGIDKTKVTTVDIPAWIEGKPVTSIGSDAFWGCRSLTSVIIPDSVTYIGGGAFQGCSSLTNVTIPDSVTSIKGSAFDYCSSLTSVIIGDSVTSIGSYAFSGCSSLTSVTIPDSVTSIEYSAFSNCSSLTSVTIPDSVTSIGDGAFFGCSSLTSVTIGNSVTSIGQGTFYACSSLVSVTIPNSVTSIGELDYYSAGAFEGCSSLTNVTIPDSVTSIEYSAFSNCSSLTSVTIPDSVTSIGDGAFSGCSSLTSVTIPDSVTFMGNSAFSSCSSLPSVTIPDSVTSMGDSVFASCSSLTSVTIGDSVTSINGNHGSGGTFEDCSSLTSVTIGDSVTYIWDRTFYGCTKLAKIYFPKSSNIITLTWQPFPDTATFYVYSGSWAEGYAKKWYYDYVLLDGYRVRYETNGGSPVSSHNAAANTLLTEPATPTRKNYSFTGWFKDSALTQAWRFGTDKMPAADLTLYAGWTWSSKDYSFDGSTITKYNGRSYTALIPSEINRTAITTIAAGAFTDTNVTMVRIPASVTTIAAGAFSGTGSLHTITVAPDNTAFAVSAEGALMTKNGTRILHMPIARRSAAVTIPSTVTTIDADAFKNQYFITSLTLAEGLQTIGANAFYGCTGLQSVTIPNSVTTIGTTAFGGLGFSFKLYGTNSTTHPAAVYAATNTIPYNIYRVHYYEGDRLIISQNVPAGTTLSSVYQPTAEGLLFGGWYKDSGQTTPFDPATEVMPAADLPLYLKMNSEFAITNGSLTAYNGTDGNITLPSDVTSIAANALVSSAERPLIMVTIPSTVTTIDTNAFSGTPKPILVGDAGSAAQMFAQTNGYTFQIRKYTLSYITQGAPIADTLVAPNAALPLPTPVRDNHTFGGWYKDAAYTAASGTVMPASDLVLHAKWTKVDASLQDDVFAFIQRDSHAVIIGYNGSAGAVTIPATLHGLPVTEIADYAFFGNRNLYSVTLPDSITKIGASAFAQSVLRSITMTNNVATIGASAFGSCKQLQSVVLSTGVKVLPTALFRDCTALLNINLHSGITEIGTLAFDGCKLLQSLTLPSTVNLIGNAAFQGCAAISTVNIPTAVTSIGTDAFNGCTNLQAFTAENVSGLSVELLAAPAYQVVNGVLLKGSTLVQYPNAKTDAQYTVPSNITRLDDDALRGNQHITKVVVPQSVTGMGTYVFADCPLLQSVQYTGTSPITTLPEGTYQSCVALNNLSLPANTTEIGSSAYAYCSSLSALSLGGTKARSIGTNAFRGCAEAAVLTMPSTLQTIGSMAFSDCITLNKVVIPASVTDIGSNAFQGCTSLTKVGYAAGNPPATIGKNVFENTDPAFQTVNSGVLFDYTLEYNGNSLTITRDSAKTEKITIIRAYYDNSKTLVGTVIKPVAFSGTAQTVSNIAATVSGAVSNKTYLFLADGSYEILSVK